MKNLKFLASLMFIAILLFACKEEPLSPNEDAAKMQQAGIDYLNNGGSGNTGGGSGGGNGGGSGGGTTVDEYFSADVNGVTKSSPDPFYQEGLGIKQITSSISSTSDLFQINVFGTLEVKTIPNPIISYFQSQTSIYEAFNGELILESVTADLVQGTFYFDAANNATNDTISITNGRFRVER